jgi:replication factor C subunit 3/5
MLWVDKYRPTDLVSLDYHDDISQRLESLAKNPASLPHLFFYGPSGAGKRTRISAFLGALFGPSAHKLKLNQREFTTPTGRTVEIHMISSDYHIELSPGDAGTSDRFVIQDVLKDIASSKNIRSSVANMQDMMGNNTGNKKTADNEKVDEETNPITAAVAPVRETEIKVVVLHQVDRLSKQAQAALRRTMEKYAVTCRLILCCDSPSKLIAPLRSRCLGIRVAAPCEDEVCMTMTMNKIHFCHHSLYEYEYEYESLYSRFFNYIFPIVFHCFLLRLLYTSFRLQRSSKR